ncbi:MAG TPA: hypothetical protein VM097_13300 [Mycobacteriales bacterium]|nr:hypothetical protein [Mycobacteriales bacterium]
MRVRALSTLALLSLAAVGVQTASAGDPSTAGNKLQCFDGTQDGYSGSCSLDGRSATLTNPVGGYSGVYVARTNLAGKRLADVNQLAFSYAGATSGGSPRITLPADIDGDGTWEDFISADAVTCNDGAGTVDVINDADCAISFNGGSGAPAVGWAAFVAANPGVRVATDAIPFVIADQAGTVTVSNVRIGRGPARAAK